MEKPKGKEKAMEIAVQTLINIASGLVTGILLSKIL